MTDTLSCFWLKTFLLSRQDAARVQSWKLWSATSWCRTSFWAPRRQKNVLNVAISQADVCNKSSRSGELYSIWHVSLQLQVGIKTKKNPTYTSPTCRKLKTSTLSERETGAGKMMKRVPRRGSGTFSQPVAKTLTSFCLHFGQTSSRLQSQWDLSGQMRHLL